MRYSYGIKRYWLKLRQISGILTNRLLISECEDWNIDKFLAGKERYVLMGAPFGIGKTSYAYKLAADLAEKHLREFNSFIPIYVPLNNHLNNIDDNNHNVIYPKQ